MPNERRGAPFADERRGATFADDPLPPNSGSKENDGDDEVFMDTVEGIDDDGDNDDDEEERVRPLVVNDCICRNLAQLSTRLKFRSH